MHILIAPNAFKNSLTATAAAAAIQRGLAHAAPGATSECFPIGDGGDGTADLLIDRLHGQRIPAKARDPLGRNIQTYFGLAGSTAIIEMANASGLRLLTPQELNPLRTTTLGTGDLIRAALDHNPTRIIIGMGGSATVDGGTGILQSLGAKFLNSHGQPLTDLPAQLPDLASIDLSALDPRLATHGPHRPALELIVLCDVTNPLTGPNGAATIFGPQKGATPSAVLQLESGLQRLAHIIARQTGVDPSTLPRTGTAGGAAAGLHALLGASLVSGIEYFLDLTNFNESLSHADYLITGEGALDEQTLQGKAPFGVAIRAKEKGIPVIALTGRLPKNSAPLQPYFDKIISINPPNITLAEALSTTAGNLERIATQLVKIII